MSGRRFRLIVDGQGIQGEGRRRGVGRYAREVLAGLARVRPDWHILLATASHLGPVDPPPGVEVVEYTPPGPVEFADGPAHDLLRLHFADWACSHHPDAVLVLSPFEAGGVPLRFVGAGGPVSLAVMHDLIPLLFPDHYLFFQPLNGRFYPRQLRQVMACDAAFTNSACTRDDLLTVAPTLPVTNIAGAVASDFPRHDPTAALRITTELFARKGVTADPNGGFLLYVGGGDFRKNLEAYFVSLARLPGGVLAGRPLVIAGELPKVLHDRLTDAATAARVADRVVFLGFVTDAELAALYQTCRLFAFPSLYEGLGLPVLEALWCGADVVAANVSSIPEYSGPGTTYFDPADRTGMTRATYHALDRPAPTAPAPKQEFAAGFSWDRTAATAVPHIEAVAAGGRTEPPATRIVWRRTFGPGTTADSLRLFCDVLNAGRELTVLRLPGDLPLPLALARLVRSRSPDEVAKAEDIAPTAANVYDLDTVADLESAACWLVMRPGLLILSAELAAADCWSDPRLAAARKASVRVLVRGGQDQDFARLLAETEAVTADPDRRWRDAAVAALCRVPPPVDSFITDWAALWVAGRPAPRRTLAS